MEILNPTKIYHSDSNTLYSCQYHIIFTPKYRRKILKEDIAFELKNLILSKESEYEYKVLAIEIMKDHVHLLLDLNPKIGVRNTIAKIKGYTSSKLKEMFPDLKKKLPCLWTRSAFISTVGTVSLDVVKSYIENQKNV